MIKKMLLYLIWLSIIHQAFAEHYLLQTNWSSIRQDAESHCAVSEYVGLQKNCVILFFHIHKSGGTTICYAAHEQGLRANIKLNCNLPRAVTNSLNDKNTYERYMRMYNLNFGAMEYGPFRPNTLSVRTLYIISIRHPIDRILSDYSHTFCRSQKFISLHPCLKQVEGYSLDRLMNDDCFQSSLVERNTNYYIKQIAGCKSTGCTLSDLEAAKRALDLMSVIIITDNKDTFERYSKAMKIKTGVSLYSKFNRHATTDNRGLSSLLRYNELDMEFYRYAKHLAELRISNLAEINLSFESKFNITQKIGNKLPSFCPQNRSLSALANFNRSSNFSAMHNDDSKVNGQGRFQKVTVLQRDSAEEQRMNNDINGVHYSNQLYYGTNLNKDVRDTLRMRHKKRYQNRSSDTIYSLDREKRLVNIDRRKVVKTLIKKQNPQFDRVSKGSGIGFQGEVTIQPLLRKTEKIDSESFSLRSYDQKNDRIRTTD